MSTRVADDRLGSPNSGPENETRRVSSTLRGFIFSICGAAEVSNSLVKDDFRERTFGDWLGERAIFFQCLGVPLPDCILRPICSICRLG